MVCIVSASYCLLCWVIVFSSLQKLLPSHNCWNNTDLLSQTPLDVCSGKGGQSCIQKLFNPITRIPVVFYKRKHILCRFEKFK